MRISRPIPAALAALLAAIFCTQAAAAETKPADPAADPALFEKTVRPLLKKHCYECHSGEEPEGELDLSSFKSADSVLAGRKRWAKVLRMVYTRQMPPKDETPLAAADREAIVAWIGATLDNVDCSGPRDPGRVTIRRLNRAEYANTIRDLLGVQFDATRDFPPDDVGYGFDNIGDVLTLPPVLMEKYLAAAEQITGKAIVTAAVDVTPKQQFADDRLRVDGNGGGRGGGKMLASNGEIFTQAKFPQSGEYLLRVTAYGDQAGDEPPKMALKLDGRQLKVYDVKAISGKAEVYELRTRVDEGDRRVAMAFINDYYNPQRGEDRNLGVLQLEVVGPLGVRPEDYPASHREIVFVRPSDKLPARDAAAKVLQRLASRAYRRPSTDAEVERLLKLFDLSQKDGASFERSIQLCAQALLVSPNFLFKVELDPQPNTADNVRTLNEFELATRMSYFLWSSMPDDELLEHAWKGTLRANLDAQTRRMLKDPKSAALVENFAVQWLQLRNLRTAQPDRRLVRSFRSLRQAMRTESEMFFASVMHEDRSVLDLVSADYTFLNDRLARHYDIPGVEGEEFRRVKLPDGRRGGVLTQAGVLTVTSNPTRTSPVKRGKWIMDNILGTPPPPPPPDVPELEEKEVTGATLRRRLEVHRENPRCAVCHRQMDDLGFALENFDAVGRWRERDAGEVIDARGEFPGGEKFDGPVSLKNLLRTARKDDFVRCLSEKMLTYALGRGVEYYDQCAVDDITKRLAAQDYRFSTLVIAILNSDPFQKRRGKRRTP